MKKLFASPDDLDPEFQVFLKDASARLCEWFSTAGKNGPLPLSKDLPEVAPQVKGLSNECLLNDLQLVMEGAYQPSHPGALAHLDPPPLKASIVAELICAGLNNNLLAEELSPSLSTLERQTCQWFINRLGMPIGSGGVLASGGTLSNLMALVVARNNACLQNNSNAVVIASSEAHVSIDKAVRVMGLSKDSLCKIPTNNEGKIDLQLLKEKLYSLKEANRECIAIVGTAGTTVRGAVDPLLDLHKIAKLFDIWLHIDGAIGGIFALSGKTSEVVDGISLANSITLNPQKILGIAKTSSLLLVSKASELSSAFATGLPYIEPAWGDAHGGEIGLQGTRSAEVLKLWLGLRQLGEEGIQLLLDNSILRRKYLESKLSKASFEIISGPLHLFAFTPKKLSASEADKWTLQTKAKLLKNQFLVSRPVHQGHHYLKVVLGNPHTEFTHLDILAELINNSLEAVNE